MPAQCFSACSVADELSCCCEVVLSPFVDLLDIGDYLPYLGPLPGTLATSPGAMRAGAALQVHRERRDFGILQHRNLRGPHRGALLRFYLFTEQGVPAGTHLPRIRPTSSPIQGVLRHTTTSTQVYVLPKQSGPPVPTTTSTLSSSCTSRTRSCRTPSGASASTRTGRCSTSALHYVRLGLSTNQGAPSQLPA